MSNVSTTFTSDHDESFVSALSSICRRKPSNNSSFQSCQSALSDINDVYTEHKDGLLVFYSNVDCITTKTYEI